MARDGHAAVCLGWGDSAQLLIYGGWNGGRALSDVWVLDVHSGRWREVSVGLL